VKPESALTPAVNKVSVVLRPETAEDESFLYELYASTRAEEMALTPWTEHEKQAFLHQQCSLQLQHYRRHYGDAAFDLILLNGQSIGRVYVHRSPSEMRLMDISLLPQHRGHGIGKHLTRQLMDECQTSNRKLTLHVEHNNPAQHLYERLGFLTTENKGVYLYMEWHPGTSPRFSISTSPSAAAGD
jgi:ribosomal protein S18 acetylase RimI-like enzyme